LIIGWVLFFLNDYRPIKDSFHQRFTVLNNYRNDVAGYLSTQYLYQKDKRYIPERILEKIGNMGVDIFPWDSEYLLENRLYYTPRPIFQSFSAYTEALEKINYDFYRDKAPEYVIYDYDGIDGRYPFNDESLVNLFLINNYTPVDSFTSNERWRVLLQKKENTFPVEPEQVREQTINIRDEIAVTDFSFMKIDRAISILNRGI